MTARGHAEPGYAGEGPPASQVPVGGSGGLLCPAEVIAMEADQGEHGVGVRTAIDLTGLFGQVEARLDLGDGVIPLPRDEAREGEVHLVGRQGETDTELLAGPHPGTERGPGLVEPVQLDEDASLRHPDREAVSLQVQALIGQADRLIDGPLGVAKLPAGLCDPRDRGHRDADRQVITGGRGQAGLLRRGRGAVEVAQRYAREARPRPGGCSLGRGQRRRRGGSLQFLQRVAHLSLSQQGVPEADAGHAVRTGIVVAAEQRAADLDGVRDPPGQHQAARSFGE